MAFVRLDDGWLDNPKLVQAGTLASLLYTAAITYANRHLTDGFVPAGILRRLVDWEGISEHDQPVTSQALGDRLVATGLWHEVEGGFEIHDYLAFQPTRAEVETRRNEVSKSRKKAGAKGGKAAAAKRQQASSKTVAKRQQAGSKTVASEQQNDSPNPTQPNPMKDKVVEVIKPSGRARTAAQQRAERTRERLGIVGGAA